MSVPLLRWEVGGPYDVVFSTRVGGVSEGPFESLNLGRRTGDEVERVDENRRRLCAEVDADEQALTLGFQTHSTVVNRAEAGSRGVPGDALWTDEPGVPMLALGADCVLMAMARTNGAEPALAVIHAGWRGLIDGVVDTTAKTIGPGFAAVVGPIDRALLLRGGRGGREPVPRPLRGRHRQRRQARPLDCRGAGRA